LFVVLQESRSGRSGESIGDTSPYRKLYQQLDYQKIGYEITYGELDNGLPFISELFLQNKTSSHTTESMEGK
jgi:hypothetical protein